MIASTMNSVKRAYLSAGQEHLFKYWNELTDDERSSLMEQLSNIPDPAKFLQDVQNAMDYSSSISESREFEPLPKSTSYSSVLDSSKDTLEAWNNKGLELIAKSKVAVVLMAGGQGTRLGSCNPKGIYDVGLPSHKSLFQLQCERIIKLKQLAASKSLKKDFQISLPLYVMTSCPTRVATETFFVDHAYFGLPSGDVIFFNQGTLPAVSLDGKKFLLSSKSSLYQSPDGNGGFYKALHDNQIVEDFEKRGIEHVHAYCVDNILVKVADPVFLGYSALGNYQVTTKVVRKSDPLEKVGLIVLDKNTQAPCVIEYSEITEQLSQKRDPTDAHLLYFRAANIVTHYYKVDFLKQMVPEWISSRKHLPYHIAKKKINYLDSTSDSILTPKEVNGLKMEQFIFDVFQSVKLDRFGCLEVDRSLEFSPLKNSSGTGFNCPETCRKDCLRRSTGWIIANGGKVDTSDSLVEISPLTSYNGEGLEFSSGRIYKNEEII
ncbi:hypothetical protein FOA43_002413 [Brettanomyces nanus]|uniref:UDP-N-acetylglucosamine diphosphorylase n=1 Tax=Eeniella nana TaxID=13502 RepID=A0A875S2D1_EENNA|nr:uncharacterized protein FOA43_002413 [Brettanomyces nanus]QPG75073.1 hypothetical protein FOA43_002413 [Brettanomyces nanus]